MVGLVESKPHEEFFSSPKITVAIVICNMIVGLSIEGRVCLN